MLQKVVYVIFSSLFLFLAVPGTISAQGFLQTADSLFHRQQYARAFSFYQQLQQNTTGPVLAYKLGVCYLHSPNNKLAALKYLQKACEARQMGNNQVPADAFFYLGKAYHYAGQYIFGAINEGFTPFLEQADSSVAANVPLVKETYRLIGWCKTAEEYRKVRRLKNVQLTGQQFPLNTSYQEVPSVISADGRTMVITSNRLQQELVQQVYGNDYVFLPPALQPKRTGIYFSRRDATTGEWSFPELVPFAAPHVRALSLSNDGKMMLLAMGDSADNLQVYLTEQRNRGWSKPMLLGNSVNVQGAKIKGACFAMAGQQIIFASNMPGGLGGFDLYEVNRGTNRTWSAPRNMGSMINSPDDEINPCIKSSNRVLYFSSNRPESMGYFDIFKSEKDALTGWARAENLGYPVNSPYNEDFFVQSANGQHTYLASDRNTTPAYGDMDIVRVEWEEEEVPLSIVTGNIKVFKDGEVLPVELRVEEYSSMEKQFYIYGPDSAAGRHYMLLQPNHSYTVDLQLSDYQLNGVSIDIPAGTYQYQLDIEVHLNSLVVAGSNLGDELVVKKVNFKQVHIDSLGQQYAVEDIQYDALVLLLDQIVLHLDAEGSMELENTIPEDFQYVQAGEEEQTDQFFDKLLDNLRSSVEEINPWHVWDLSRVISSKDTSVVRLKNTALKAGPLIELLVEYDKRTPEFEKKYVGDLHTIAKVLQSYPQFSLNIKGYYWQKESLADERLQVLRQFFRSMGISDYRVVPNIMQLSKKSENLENSFQVSLLYSSSDN